MALGILEGVKDKSFLSFTFDNKSIEDFNFVVIYEGDRLSTALQPVFNNSTSTIPGRTGTIYWGTDITGYTLNLKIATDRATSRQIANLKKHFSPGKYAKLSLAESEYCYCYAYISTPSTFNFIPFEEEVTINGKTYQDTVYKGDASLEFFIPQVYFYSDIAYDSFGDAYQDKPWFLASGLPLKSSITQRNCFLANGVIANETSQAFGGTVYAYNAGNAPASAEVKFSITKVFTSGLIYPWSDIRIGNVEITKPRLFRDIDYTLALLNTHSSDWSIEAKVTIINDLRETLDSQLRSELIGIVNATGAGLNWTTPTTAMNAIRALVNGIKFSFSIDAIEVQAVMSGTVTVHTFGSNISTVSMDIVENIGDSTNGEYLIIEGSDGLKSSGLVEVQSITINQQLSDLEIFFPNTYLV